MSNGVTNNDKKEQTTLKNVLTTVHLTMVHLINLLIKLFIPICHKIQTFNSAAPE